MFESKIKEDKICTDIDIEFKRFKNELIKQGYILEDGTPIKCTECDSKNIDTFNEYRGEFGLEEYSVKCQECNKKLGCWSLGYWEDNIQYE